MSEDLDQRDPRSRRNQIVPCNRLNSLSAMGWLRAGWKDFWRAPGVSLLYGGLVFVLSWVVVWLAWQLGGYVLLISALSGFIFIAPLLAFALYSVSRLLELGQKPSLAHTIQAIRLPLSNSAVFTLILLVVFLLWARAGMMVQVFFPFGKDPAWDHIITFLLIGSAVGSVFASISFAASVFSLPMLANRNIDVITSVISSINAVLRNKFAMFVWAVSICLLTLLGFLTAGLGLIVIIPWLAYASWHGYREALDISSLDTLPAVKARTQ
jgi:uncharacterized membrane protein